MLFESIEDSLTEEVLTAPDENGKTRFISGYNLGFQRKRLGDGDIVGHAGEVLGTRSCTFFDPKSGLVVSVAANVNMGSPTELVESIMKSMLEARRLDLEGRDQA
jgi:hypothetical protein